MSLSSVAVVASAMRAQFSGDNLVMCVAIAWAESNLNSSARNINSDGSVDRGLWQINSKWHPEVSDACAFDPNCAASAVFKISRGGTYWNDWVTFRNGSYQKYLDMARGAYAAFQHEITVPPRPGPDVGPPHPGPIPDHPPNWDGR